MGEHIAPSGEREPLQHARLHRSTYRCTGLHSARRRAEPGHRSCVRGGLLLPCARAVRLGPQPRPPFSVAEYCPAASVTAYQDPRRHSASLAYVVPVAGDCCSRQNALEPVWSSPQEVFSPAVQSEMPGGHECCRSTGPRTRRARPFTRRRRPSAPSSGRVGETGTRARAGRGAMALSSPRRAVGGA
ncbi:DUF4916 domain-containing protein [Streptomyces vinaceus]|uniref:DUF4916 domain-containing protein n=1 Tax=Streptomyces vinaceus TaxID=1960 RepID=UPI0038296EFB